MIVIDVGCARYGGDHSIDRMIDRYHPHTLYGFDPAWKPSMLGQRPRTRVKVFKAAAWTYDGQVRFMEDGLNGQVGDAEHWPFVRCIDLARFIDELPAGELILKLDCEGSEIDLLEHLIATNIDLRVNRLVVEWHPVVDAQRRRAVERKLACPVEQWRF